MIYKSYMKIYLAALILALVMSGSVLACDKGGAECKIMTNAHCNGCKAKIEKALNKQSGVQSSNLTLDNKVVSVKYDPNQTTPAQLVKTVSDVGFEATVVTGDTPATASDVKTSTDNNCCSGKGACKTKSKTTKKKT